MIPLQDVVPSGRTPVVTLTLIVLNIVVFIAPALGVPTGRVLLPFAHIGIAPLLIGTLFLWLFGDNVEARAGRAALIAIYLSAGFLTGLGAMGAITAVLGAYFLLLPRSRVLMLVPFPISLVEVPAAFFLGVWCVLQLVQFVRRPATVWAFVVAFLIGAVTARLTRRSVEWS